MSDVQHLLTRAIADPRHGWSVGTFGAIGEFVRDADEAADHQRDAQAETIRTERGAMRVTPRGDVRVVAFDTLGSDGETWGQSVAFCLPMDPDAEQGVVRALGPDKEAIRPEDRDALLFDMGVGRGLVRMCARTRAPDLIAALQAMEGKPLFSPEGAAVGALVVKTQPHRVMLSPLARVEVYSPIPPPGGESPEGPHTHLLPRLIASGRTHAANAPIPEGLQPVLMLHPRSPWRDALGRRVPFDAGLDALFEELLQAHALPEDREIRARTEQAVEGGVDPSGYAWPDTRRGRVQARITLRRLAQRRGAAAVAKWRSLYDPTHHDDDIDDDAAQHG